MSKINIPKGYEPKLNLIETELAIKLVKDTFQQKLAKQLNLTRVSAPLFVLKSSGLNDDLNGIEGPVSFTSNELNIGDRLEVIHSLAKWKRDALHRYDFKVHSGLYTDMNAIRKDEEFDNIHSMYVDQWDWELIINKEDRSVDFLKETVKKIYSVLLEIEDLMLQNYPQLSSSILPKDIHFITTQELEDLYPNASCKEREHLIAKEKKAVFVMQVGGILNSGTIHDGRAPDYDDWSLNGDIIVWNDVLKESFEISSMGIRVDKKALLKQLEERNVLDRTSLTYHQNIINDVLPLSIGGGIGQSRLCMYFLRKAHIGEVQASVWDEMTLSICKEHNIILL